MDDDVKMSMVQAHEIRITKVIVYGVIFTLAMGLGTCAYTNKLSNDSSVQEAKAGAEKAKAEADKAHDDHALFELWAHPPTAKP